MMVTWNKVIEVLKEHDVIEKETLDSWIIPKTKLLMIDDDTAFLSVGNTISKKILEQSKKEFEAAFSEVCAKDMNVQLMDEAMVSKYNLSNTVQPRQTYDFEIKSAIFNDTYTFENFVRGGSNEEAYSACLQCCNERGKHTLNPIMLYGNSGLGKTHLLHAIGNYLQLERPECKVYYQYSGGIVDLILEAMRSNSVHGNNVDEVKRQLSKYDYFLIDDIQNLKQSSSQEVFFSIYNELIIKNAQLIVTSGMHPDELIGIQDRLISRFKQGLTINISKPEFDTSRAILRKKLEGHEETCSISDDVIDYLARKFSDDVRNLEGSLNKLIFNATLENPDIIDMDFAQRILMKEPVVINQDELTLKGIKKAVTNFYGLTYKDLEGKSRQKKIMNARHIFVYLSREYLHKPYVAIGQEIGNRDHTTILSSYDRAIKLMNEDDAFKKAIESVLKLLNIK